MSPATPWTELTGTLTPYFKGVPSAVSGTLDAVIIFGGLAIPLTAYQQFADATASYVEMSLPSATVSTEMSVAQTAWTKVSL